MEFLNPDKVINELNILPGSKGADFGSGSGYFALALAKKIGPDGFVVAIDILDPALEALLEKAKREKVMNIITKRANLEIKGASGLADDSQDWVLIANLLFQTDRKKEVLDEAMRVLRKNGMLILIEWQKNHFPASEGLYVVDEQALTRLVDAIGFSFIKKFHVGSFHYGLIYRKE